MEQSQSRGEKHPFYGSRAGVTIISSLQAVRQTQGQATPRLKACVYLLQSVSLALGFRPFAFYLWCLSVVGLRVFVSTVHFLGSNKEPINRVLPPEP